MMPTFVGPNTFSSDTGNFIVPKNPTYDIIKNIIEYGLNDLDRFVLHYLHDPNKGSTCECTAYGLLSHPLYRSNFS